ncbi:Hypothetical protein ETEE_0888 [Edwardsiella anguillarum ET080813]|uniref:Uncharacterized protein n=1 Tax=Edwardsiella anguillarum ET080813 TaxID=667120 RepID=A0A076LKP9_9GAMM|nr:Hypothetical protein ETEE_0888 [Edwardsiella anguillarum ET080813]
MAQARIQHSIHDVAVLPVLTPLPLFTPTQSNLHFLEIMCIVLIRENLLPYYPKRIDNKTNSSWLLAGANK